MTVNTQLDTTELRQNVRLLGDTLGEVIRTTVGEGLFQSIESIRQTSKSATEAEQTAALFDQLKQLDANQLLLISRGFCAVFKPCKYCRSALHNIKVSERSLRRIRPNSEHYRRA